MNLPEKYQGDLRFVVWELKTSDGQSAYACADGAMNTAATAEEVVSRMQMPGMEMRIVAEIEGISDAAARYLYENFTNLPILQGQITRQALMQLLVSGHQ